MKEMWVNFFQTLIVKGCPMYGFVFFLDGVNQYWILNKF